MAAAGSAIGLGNLWKFPYITWANEGGAFVLIYLICIVAIGLPIMMAEILIGRMTQKSAYGGMREAVGPRWAWVGGLGVLGGFVILSFYAVIAGWTLRYFVKCLSWSINGFDPGAASGDAFGGFVSNGAIQIGLAATFMIVTALVVYRGVGGGIEKTARLLMPVLFVILVLLLGTALTMKGAGDALRFIFNPDFSRLEPPGALEALGHAFFTLSLGMGAMITYGSYLRKEDSVVRSAGLVVILDTLIALAATIIMFSVIFSVEGMSEQITKSTAGMLFITLPSLFYTQMPFGNILAPLFYLLVGFAALTSTISLLEVVVSYFIDEKGVSRGKATTICAGLIFGIAALCGLSLGASPTLSNFSLVYAGTDHAKHGLFDHLDYLASNWILPVGGFFITIAVGWFMSRAVSERELTDANPAPWFHYGAWRFFIRYVAPVAVAAIILAVISGKDFS